MDDYTATLEILKLTISGPTLSSLLNHLNTSAGPTTGVIYGDFSLLTPTALSDDPPSLSPPPSSLIATVSSTSPTPSTPTPSTRHPIIGSYSTRRLSPLRPSLLDHSLAFSLSLSHPRLVFLLLTTPLTLSHANPIHTHDYRAYRFNPVSRSFDPIPVEVVNLGPGFRGQYGNFSPKSGLPFMPCVAHVGSPMRDDGKSSSEMKRVGNDQRVLDGYVSGGYDVGSLIRLVGSDSVGYMGGVEELYETMLGKLQGLARVVEVSSARVLELIGRVLHAWYVQFLKLFTDKAKLSW